jgi:hypothetical protein
MIAGTLHTVRFDVHTPALAWILLVLATNPEEFTITCGSNGLHAEHSAHYRGEAVDVRSHDLDTMARKRARQQRLAFALGPNFTVLLEPYDVFGSTAAEHLHCQLRAGETFAREWLDEALTTRWLTAPVHVPPSSSSAASET